jgi:hypothetical protein
VAPYWSRALPIVLPDCFCVPHRIGESLQRRERTANALVFLPADPGVENNDHSRRTRHVDDVHSEHLFRVFSFARLSVGPGYSGFQPDTRHAREMLREIKLRMQYLP